MKLILAIAAAAAPGALVGALYMLIADPGNTAADAVLTAGFAAATAGTWLAIFRESRAGGAR
ncbi:hypothetical protein [Nonomuraea roseoviolacea]|uniref:Uncharacterized protein n=1 Tax=Nonomuraea roseoviolacea subsp. carminata TaxID=160689 RepID=A0ABT1KAF2_9ACTN|nr:hypothetical protein [Nonomuraea roseoviolacea]MCP2350667.1 hypothetical protein [Nonomuraea roseoviolacea subsp. carminata]